jgi:MtN3 and saliva related transmembrane protein
MGAARRAGPLKRQTVRWQDILGYAAAVLTTSSFVPQALLTLRTRDVSGISRSMYTAFTAGVALWLAYGVATEQWPVVVANTVTLMLALTILVIKVVEDRRQAALSAAKPDQNRYDAPNE